MGQKANKYNLVIISEEDFKNIEIWNKIYKINPEAKDEIERVLEKKGLIYGFIKDGIVEAIFVFNRTNQKKDIELKYISTYYTEQCKNKVSKFKRKVNNRIKRDVSKGKYSAVEIEDKVLTTKGILLSTNIMLFFVCSLLGGSLSTVLNINNIFIGQLIGGLLGIIFILLNNKYMSFVYKKYNNVNS